MRVTVLRHLPGEDIGVLADVLDRRGARVDVVDMPVVDCGSIAALAPDLVMVMGGPLGVPDRDLFPFLDAEIGLVRERLDAGLPTIGICLGAQIIAAALGATVFRAEEPEIGWYPLELTPAGRASCLQHIGEATPVMHWHGDQFDLPDGVTHLARTTACPNQAFARGPHVLALQFHPEVRPADLEYWYVGSVDYLRAHPELDICALRADAGRHAPAAGAAACALFDEWLLGAGL